VSKLHAVDWALAMPAMVSFSACAFAVVAASNWGPKGATVEGNPLNTFGVQVANALEIRVILKLL
jgi:hypothetical protein